MTPLFKKLNLAAQPTLYVLNAPASFEAEIAALDGRRVECSVTGPVQFGMAFVITEAELIEASTALAQAADGDAILWMVYPKQSSKKYRCEFNRDSGWPTLGAAGFEPVRMVAIDADWSALRFRRVAYIKSLKRDSQRAISEPGKRRTQAR